MIRGGGRDWTTVAVDKMFSIFFAKTCRAAQFLKKAECSINSLLASFSLAMRSNVPEPRFGRRSAFRHANSWASPDERISP